MLGLSDPGIIAAYLLTFGAVLLCIFFAWRNWEKE